MSDSLGEFEQIVLLAILRLGANAYGVPIRAEIMRCTDRNPTAGALYTVLDRLEGKAMVRSRMGESTAARGGRPKRFFNVTSKGELAVTRAQLAYQKLMNGLKLTEAINA
ncbi:MAG TPA: helix-turn-helix transcriptional regulator [Acidobacteriaceae bacterium]|jgi:DNA-binding PadR family transcriptional regulator|nr:helix-turn-helix transcriptional regulator [Acidobacteriaceae bacterium]